MLKIRFIRSKEAELQKGKSLFSLEEIERGVDRNPVYPGTYTGLTFKSGSFAENIGKYILGDFFSVLLILDITKRCIKDLIAKQLV